MIKLQKSLTLAVFLLLFFGGQRKVTKETRPAIADSPLNRLVSVARAKTR